MTTLVTSYTELLRQITEISNEIKNIYGNDYGEQYSNVAIKLLNQNPNNMNEYHILIEATHSLIDCDYKVFYLVLKEALKILNQYFFGVQGNLMFYA